MPWYAVLFWIWVVVSLGIFVWRRINGSGKEPDAETTDEPSSPLTKQWAPPPPDPDDPSPTAAADPDGTDDRVPDPAEGATATSPGEASAASLSPSSMPGRGATLADLLSGITLPLGLVPLTQSAPAAGPAVSIVVATDAAGPEQVGTALADEIEALGYTVRSTGPHSALADGPRGAIEIEIHPHAAAATDGGALRFPTASENSVVVELRVAGTPHASD